MSVFLDVKEKIQELCDLHNVPVPDISLYEKDDRCDTTDYEYIRIKPVDDLCNDYHAKHVFGHYICGLHELNDAMSDRIADVIAELL